MSPSADTPRRWIPVARIDDIPVAGSRCVQRAQGLDVAVFRTTDDSVFALLDRCPHKGGPLSQGLIYGKRVACPLHNWQIELESGEAVAPDVGCAHRHHAKVESGRVLLALNQAEKCA